jgi:DNA polymerase-3 subunit gamma/tau
MGFEMVLLRMLAFRPDGSLAPHRPAPQPAPPSLRTAPAAPPVDVSVSVSVPGAVGSSQSGQSTAAGTVQAAAGSDWAGMIQAMNLTGITRQLALHCHLHSLEAERCVLVLAAEGANLRTDRLVRNLESALGQHLGRAIKLIVRDGTESRSLETPAAQASREQAERQKAAEREIEQDSTVNAFREQFGARIVPGSTQPL